MEATEGVEAVNARDIRAILIGLSCTHRRMRYCCPKPCGHLYCPDCGLSWDEAAEK